MNALRWVFLVVLAGCLGIGVWTPNYVRAQATNEGALLRIQGLDDLLVAGPVTHKNLSAFVLYRDQRARKETDYLTLEEGIEDGLVEVTEDQQEQVQQLRITNRSSKPLFLAAGELVKGGKQDRTLQFSMVVPPKTKNAPLPSFCVEQSRWTGGKQFAPGKNIAANSSQQAIVLFGQQGVWHSVKDYKRQLRTNAARASGKAVQMSTTSSLNEELADGDVRDLLSSYETALSRIGANLPRPLGLAYAVDGKLTALHVFHSSLLFSKLRPKLIRSAAIDAAAGAVDKRPPEVSLQDLGDFIAAAWDGEKSTHKLGMKNIVTRYAAKTTFTCELRHDRQLVHVQIGRIDRRMRDALRGMRQQVPQLNSLPRQQRMIPNNSLPQQQIIRPRSSIQILEPQQTDENPGDAQQDRSQIRSTRPRRSSRQ